MPSKGRPRVAIRIDEDLVQELDRLASVGSTELRSLTRADVIRYALNLGLEQVREEFEGSKKRRK